MKKITLIALSAALLNPAASFAYNDINGNSALSLTHDEIFDMYKDAKILRDELELQHSYKGVSAIHLSLKGLERRIRVIDSNLNADFTLGKDAYKFKKMIAHLLGLVSKLHKIDYHYSNNSKMIDTYYSLSLTSENHLKFITENSHRIVKKNDTGESWAYELNLISKVLLDIANGHKEKSLKLILERGDITGQTERPHAEALNFKF